MPKSLFVITYLTTLFFSGCSYLVGWIPSPYRPDIHQGNIISQEMVDQLKPGMTKRQVVFVMGTPLGKDPFHYNRWDYIYSNNPRDGDKVQKSVTLLFDKDELAALQGDFRPGTLPALDASKDQTVNIPKIERERTLWEKISGLFGAGD